MPERHAVLYNQKQYMNIRPVTELTLYRYRYAIGHSLLALLIVGLLTLNFQSLPAGLSTAEQSSALASSQISLQIDINNPFDGVLYFLQTTNAVDLPYHLLQKASLTLFGVSPLGVRLPTIIMAALSAFMLFVLLRRWLQDNAAVVMGVLIATSSWFLTIGRIGTPDIMIVFWTSLLLMLATLISQESKNHHAWRGLAIVIAGLSFYTPYMAYLFLAAAIAAFTQPHLRYIIRSSGRFSAGSAILLLALLQIPLSFHIWRDPAVLQTLLALPTSVPGPLEFLQNLVAAGSQLLNPFKYEISQAVLPLLSVPTTIFAVMGVVKLIIDWHSVRSHLLLLWLAILMPVIALGATGELKVVLFVPLMLLCAIGVQALFRYWYRIFPRNPYARVFGLVPLSVLVISMISFEYQRYFVAVPYATSTITVYDQDPFVLHDKLTTKAYREQRLLVIAPKNKVDLYKIDKQLAKNLEVVPSAEFTATNNATSIIVAEEELAKLNATQRGLLPGGRTELLVNDRKENGLRFRVFSQ